MRTLLVPILSLSLILLVPLQGRAGVATPVPVTDTADSQARALFAADWQWRLQNQPELATALGDKRFNHLLSDTSLAASLATGTHEKLLLEQARQLLVASDSQLDAATRLSLDVFIDQQERRVRAAALYPYRYAPLTNQDGLHLTLPRLVVQMPFTDEADYRAYLARLNALPAHVDGLIEQMREAQRLGWSAPKTSLRLVPELLRQLRESVAGGALERPFREIVATIAAPVRLELAAAGAAALNTRAIPALQKLEDYVRLEALPQARDSVGVLAMPGGAEYYRFLLSDSTELTPQAVHALGLREVARLQAAMGAAIARTGFKGNFAQFATFANSDPRLFASDADKLVRRYRRQLARANAAAARLFDNVPAEVLEVRTIDAGADDQGAAYYEAASEVRAAAIVVNTSRLASRPLWETETVVLHEGGPGHHLQVTRARQLDALPAFRRYGWHAPFGEGWALYAEGLGAELGMYGEAFSDFGHLNSDLLRSARLVVDSGLHALGWSRQQAIDYLNANTANARSDNEVEVDRYIAAPGQALSYKLGQLRLQALRERAQERLGARFDIRRFHAALLDNGALPLTLLERQVERWQQATLAAAGASTKAPAPAQ